jgi:hypothetical protein
VPSICQVNFNAQVGGRVMMMDSPDFAIYTVMSPFLGCFSWAVLYIAQQLCTQILLHQSELAQYLQWLQPHKKILQTPFKSRSLGLAHRIVLAPMTCMRASDKTAIINPSAATYYSERTIPGSLLISEGTIVHPQGKGFPRTPGLWTHDQALSWKPIVDAVHAKGGTFFVQLWHVGRVSVPSQTGGLLPLSSTGAHLPGAHMLFGSNDQGGRERLRAIR